jgi:hypothetical protein
MRVLDDSFNERLVELEALEQLDYFREIAQGYGYGNTQKQNKMWSDCPKRQRFKILERLAEEPIIAAACEWDAGRSEEWDTRLWSEEEVFDFLPEPVQIYVFLSYEDGRFTSDGLRSNIRQHCPEYSEESP